MRINDLNYHVQVEGKGEPLLLLHGFTGSSDNWQPHVEIFAQQYQVITLDLIGHGHTDSPADATRYEMAKAAADLIRIISQIASQSVHLLGYSMGGRLALYVTLHYPKLIKTLILESASPGLAEHHARRARIARDEALADRIQHEGIESFANMWEQIPLFATQKDLPMQVRERLRSQRLQNSPLGLANSSARHGNRDAAFFVEYASRFAHHHPVTSGRA